MFVACDSYDKSKVMGCIGIGSFHGLPLTEGIGEIRELVVDKNYRRRGIGQALLEKALSFAILNKYQKLYLETTPDMENAQSLFQHHGFKPVRLQSSVPDFFTKHSPSEQQIKLKKNKTEKQAFPSYFILELSR